jgi:serine phosphatase RsbU (regulator of sigma subunit)
VRLVSCGHPPALLLHDGKATEVALEPGAPLGIGFFESSPPHIRTVRLERGDRLFLASDGVTESRNKAGAFYPLAERLTALADEEEPAALIDRVWEDLLRFCPAVQDDITMLVLTPRPDGDP